MGVVVKGVVEKDVVIGGVRLHYAEGPDNGPALVLVPGQSMSWQSYCKVIPLLAAVRCPITLIKANSFRHPELGLVGAMGDEDVDRALGAQPAIRVERWPVAHVVHMATPKKYAALVDSLAAHSSDPS